MQIKKTTFKKIKCLKKNAQKDHVVIDDFNNCTWFGAKIGNDFYVGCAGLVIKGKNLRFKGDFVSPNFRNQGIYRKLFEYRMNYTEKLNFNKITAFCTPMSLSVYLANGFKRVSQKRLRDGTNIWYVISRMRNYD